MGMMTYSVVVYLSLLIGICTSTKYHTLTNSDCSLRRLSGIGYYVSSYSKYAPLIVKIDTRNLSGKNCSIYTKNQHSYGKVYYQFRKYFYPDLETCKADISLSNYMAPDSKTCGVKKRLYSLSSTYGYQYIHITFPADIVIRKYGYRYGNVQAEIEIYTDSTSSDVTISTSSYADTDLDSWVSTVYQIPIIIGGVIGGLFALAIIITIIVVVACTRRRRRTPGQVVSTNQQGVHVVHYPPQPGQGMPVNAPYPLAPGMQPSAPNPHYPHYPQEYKPVDPAYAPTAPTGYGPAMPPPSYDDAVS